ncbi:MAG TPA: N,N-dimethylformamidase beta subunit family domain-containing protein, partial [Baekduia sp.]|nr:N,N-dimethylformamidase beta subunit family domain-containing protein [Baekduia sp.]
MKRYLLLILIMVGAAAATLPQVAHTAPNPPTGLTAMALDGKVSLAWQPSSGATSYRVYRGTTANNLALVGTSSTATYTDTATNGTTYYYAVSAVDATESTKSAVAQAKPVAKSCGAGNAIAQENCFPGTSAWKLTNAGRAYDNGIEGFATATSVNQGGSVGLKVNTGPKTTGSPYHVEIYRMGWYGGTHGRLVGTIPSQSGANQDSCQDGSGNTGLLDCSNWTTTTTITTSTSWPSGVYWLRLVRDDNGTDNAILLVVRQDGSHSAAAYEVPTSTYEAYNSYGGKSLYTWNSSGANTVAGTPRAVKVSYDRPYVQTYNGIHDFFPQADLPNVGFLERQGYDVTYLTDTDLHTNASLAADHKSLVSGAHSEYWSTEMRNGVTAARNAGTGLFFTGANEIYWRIRLESSPFSGTANRVEVAYKTTESGIADPVSPTGTWRDPAGPNAPENALSANAYIGDDDTHTFPMAVSSTQGKNRIWRHTTAATLASGASQSIAGIVGWEWDARQNNGQEPSGTTSWSTSAVSGNILQDYGRVYASGPATTESTAYRAASGSWVVTTGTNFWARGLDVNSEGLGSPTLDVQQATTNILADMNTRPTTPISGIVVDPATGPAVQSKTPAAGATGVATTSSVTVTFDSDIDVATLTSSTFFLKTAGGSTVTASISYDAATDKATLNPSSPLGGNATYTATVKGGASGVAGWGGTLAADVTWSFTTGAGTPPTILSVTPAAGATDVPTGSTVVVKFDRDMLASSITATSFTLTPQLGTAVSASVSYNAATDTATLTPASALDPSRQYTVTLTTAIKGADGTALASDQTSTFTTIAALTISTKVPAPLATGVAPAVTVRGTFNRALDTSTVTSSNVTLKNPSGTTVAATISYDAASRTVSLAPTSSLALSTTYTVRFAAAIKGTDGSTLGSDVTWTFTTATTAPPAPTVTSTSPAAGATGVPTDTTVSATFSRAMDPATITGQTFVLRDPSNAAVATSISYDSNTNTATMTPTGLLSSGVVYTVQVTTGVRAADGTPMAATSSRTFTTADCPCTVLSGVTPASTGLDVQDGRPGTGATYELGMKFTVDRTMRLTAIRYYRDAGETGSHVGRLWNSAGTQIGSATFSGETTSGWQQAALTTPVTLSSGATYTVSVGVTTKFAMTAAGLASAVSNGPLHTVVGSNGVYGNSAGTFPTNSWNNSNYF